MSCSRPSTLMKASSLFWVDRPSLTLGASSAVAFRSQMGSVGHASEQEGGAHGTWMTDPQCWHFGGGANFGYTRCQARSEGPLRSPTKPAPRHLIMC